MTLLSTDPDLRYLYFQPRLGISFYFVVALDEGLRLWIGPLCLSVFVVFKQWPCCGFFEMLLDFVSFLLLALVDDIRIASAMVSSFERMQVARWPRGLETWVMNRRCRLLGSLLQDLGRLGFG